VNWSLETTGGTNTCSFDLNNNEDAFIITPQNVCADIKRSGWRISGYKPNYNVIHGQPRYDELAKYLIYKRKWLRVSPHKAEKAQIDPETGIWLYPLNPFAGILNKHDPVRIFVRLNHISGAVAKVGRNKYWYDLWVPAFTGFIKNVPWDDDYVGGDRVVHVECFDYRGLMERMRVRTTGLPLLEKQPGNLDRQTGGSASFGRRMAKYANLSKDGTKFGQNVNRAVLQEAQRSGLLNKVKRNFHQCVRIKQLECAKDPYKTTSADSRKKAFLHCLQYNTASCFGTADKNLKSLGQFIALVIQWNALYKPLSGEEAVIDVARDGVVTIRYKKNQASVNRQILQWGNNSVIQRGSANTPSSALTQAEFDEVKKKAQASGNSPWLYVPRAGSLTDNNDYNYRKSTIVLSSAGDIESLKALLGYIKQTPIQRFLNDEQEKEFNNSSTSADRRSHLDSTSKARAAAVDNTVARVVTSILKNTESKNQLIKTGFLLANGNPALFPKGAARTRSNLVARQTQLLTTIAALEVLAQNYKKKIDASLKSYKEFVKKLDEDFKKQKEQYEALLKRTGINEQQANIKLNDIRQMLRRTRSDGNAKLSKRLNSAGNLAELLVNEPTFEKKHTVLFSDLVRAVGKNDHPLAGMSYEEAVTWLTCSQSQIVPGSLQEIADYGKSRSELRKWNKTILFGVWGRPLTYNEVTVVGSESTADLDSDFSPYNVFMHILLPASGTGARTIVQQDITANTGNAKSFQYESRKSLIDQISELLNYQWYMSPIGDVVYEFPHYDALPIDFGKEFKGAYTAEKEITGASINEDATDIPTAWVITGMEPQKSVKQGGVATKNLFYTRAIMAPILARRLGVKVERINLQLPGVGAQIGSAKQIAGGEESMIVWGLLHIQRQLGENYQVNLKDIPARPYMLPNRPIWLVPRQKITLARSVSYSLTSPDGDATCSIQGGYSRWLNRDGTFRTISGGQRSVINYAGIFTGELKYVIRRGVNNVAGGGETDATTTKKQQRNFLSNSCGPALKQAWLQSSNYYNTAVATSVDQWGTFGSNTAGGAGAGGWVDPRSDNQGSYGTRLHRASVNPGEKGKGVINTRKAGLRIQGQREKEDNKKYYNITKLFYNPYPFGEVEKKRGAKYLTVKYMTFGFLRMHHSYRGWNWLRDKQSRPGNVEIAWHSGTDIFAPVGAKIVAPTDLQDLSCWLELGPIGWKRKAWVEIGQKYEGRSWQYNGAERRFKRFATTGKGGKPVYHSYIVKSNPSPGVYYNIEKKFMQYWKDQYDKYIKIFKKGGRGPTLYGSGKHGHAGLVLQGRGYATMPKSASSEFAGKSIYYQIAFAHCDDILGRQGTKGKFQYYGIHIDKVAKGTPICTVGVTGNAGSAHAHINFNIYRPTGYGKTRVGDSKKGTDEGVFRETLNANKEMLTTQLIMKFSGGNPTSNELSTFWKNKFKFRRFKGKRITTVQEAVALYQRINRNYNLYTKIPPRSGSQWSIRSSVLLFFKPEDIVPWVARHRWRHKHPIDTQNYNSYAHIRRLNQPGDDTSICGANNQTNEKKIDNNKRKCELAVKKRSTTSGRAASKAALAECARVAREEKARATAQSRNAAINQDKTNRKLRAAIKTRLTRGRSLGASSPRNQ
jgi:hypothetical protein